MLWIPFYSANAKPGSRFLSPEICGNNHVRQKSIVYQDEMLQDEISAVIILTAGDIQRKSYLFVEKE